jgi:hypothetical protein
MWRGTAKRIMNSFAQFINWLRVSDTAECAQVDQRICHHLHTIVPLLDAFKAKQQSLALVFSRKGPLDLAPALGALAVARILLDVGDHSGIENAFLIVCGIKATIEVNISAFEVQPLWPLAATLSSSWATAPYPLH